MSTGVRRALNRALWSLVTISILVAGTLGYLNRQVVQDHFAAKDFEPDVRVQMIIDEMKLTDDGERTFLATHPTINGRMDFNQKCSRSEHSSKGHVLGCYVDNNIYLFEVDDQRLAGVVEVTAAHELMHAVYDRSSQREREALAQRLNEEYEIMVASDPAFEERMSVYSSLSASRFANELHSVLATEVRELPPWLEDHYGTWFADRSVIVDWFDNYHSVFSSLKKEAELLQEQLDELRIQVEDESARYSESVEIFNDEWAFFKQRNDSLEFSQNQDEFYRLRDEFDLRRSMLDTWRESIEGQIARYEELRGQLSELGELSTELNNQIDSNLQPADDSQ